MLKTCVDTDFITCQSDVLNTLVVYPGLHIKYETGNAN